MERTHTMTYFLKFLFNKLSENGMTSELGSFCYGRRSMTDNDKWKMEVNRLLNVILLLCVGRITRPAVFSCEIWDIFKVGLSPSKKIFIICFSDSPSKMMENAFYFILKALFVPKIFKFLSWLFGYVEKTAWLERKIRLISKFMTSRPG